MTLEGAPVRRVDPESQSMDGAEGSRGRCGKLDQVIVPSCPESTLGIFVTPASRQNLGGRRGSGLPSTHPVPRRHFLDVKRPHRWLPRVPRCPEVPVNSMWVAGKYLSHPLHVQLRRFNQKRPRMQAPLQPARVSAGKPPFPCVISSAKKTLGCSGHMRKPATPSPSSYSGRVLCAPLVWVVV